MQIEKCDRHYAELRCKTVEKLKLVKFGMLHFLFWINWKGVYVFQGEDKSSVCVFKGLLPFRKCSEAQDNVASLFTIFYIS